MTRHPVNGLDDIVHQRLRLRMPTIAHKTRRVEFGYLRTQLDLTAGNLSQHLTMLENSGLIAIERGFGLSAADRWSRSGAAYREGRLGLLDEQ